MKQIIAKAMERGFDYDKHQFKNNCLFSPSDLYFSHDFLKAFFGDVDCDCEQGGYSMHKADCPRKSWSEHAQQLVLSEDRLEYLRRFI